MNWIAVRVLVSTAILTGLWTVTPRMGTATSLADAHTQLAGSRNSRRTNHNLYAQLFYPPVSNQRAIMVVGQGVGTVPADTGTLELNIKSEIRAQSPSSGATSQLEETDVVLTKQSLKPIVDALVGIGVPADAIEVKINTPKSNPFPIPFPSNDSPAQVVVKLDKPTRELVQQIVNVAKNAANKSRKLAIKSVSVKYATTNCQALETAAYTAAINNAKTRAQALASAMGVELEKIPSVAEPGLFDLIFPLCLKEGISSPLFGGSKSPNEPLAPAEVELRRDIFVTYPIK